MSAISEVLVGRRLPAYITTSTKETRPRTRANISVAGVTPYQPDAPGQAEMDTAIRAEATSWRGEDNREHADRQYFIDHIAAAVRTHNARFAGCADLEYEIDQ